MYREVSQGGDAHASSLQHAIYMLRIREKNPNFRHVRALFQLLKLEPRFQYGVFHLEPLTDAGTWLLYAFEEKKRNCALDISQLIAIFIAITSVWKWK